MLVSGGTGSGKTTLLNCLTRYIEHDERIITCEDAAELQLQQPHVVRLETRPPNIEGEGEITMRDLVKNCLRMRPERIIVGEVRGPEAFDLLQAMNTGHDGSMGTLHANSPREALSRLESMITMGGFQLPSKTIREMISTSIDVIVQAARLRDGSRRITHITEVIGTEGDVIITQDIFVYDIVGEDANGRIIGRHRSTGIGRPKFWERARYFNEEDRLAAALDAANADESASRRTRSRSMFGSLTTLLAIVRPGDAQRRRPRLCACSTVASRRRTRAEQPPRARSRARIAASTGRRRARRVEADAAKRRKSVQETLKELEEKQKAKAKKRALAAADAAHASRPASSWSKRTFFIFSAIMRCCRGGVRAPGRRRAALRRRAPSASPALLGLPRWIVNFLRKRRIKKFLDEFANAIDVIVRGVKAGLPLNDCIRIIANEAAEPVTHRVPPDHRDPGARHLAGRGGRQAARARAGARGELLRHRRHHPAEGRRQPLPRRSATSRACCATARR